MSVLDQILDKQYQRVSKSGNPANARSRIGERPNYCSTIGCHSATAESGFQVPSSHSYWTVPLRAITKRFLSRKRSMKIQPLP
jgi:hypothetical protein